VFTYNDPLIIAWRAGTEDDPFSDRVNESYKILNGTILLQEVPDEFERVFIQDYIEIFDPSKESVSPSKFIVNYQNGIITFDPSQEGKTVVVKSYKGRGILLYPAERIYTKDGNNIVTTIQEIIDNGQTAIEANNQLTQTIEQANIAIANANTAATTANNAADSANVAKDNAIIATENAITATIATNNAILNLEFKGEWSESIAYKKGNSVHYNNKVYICIADASIGTPLEDTLYWRLSFDASSTIEAAVTATNQAVTATNEAVTATNNAITATTAANASREAADLATSNANAATIAANTARDNAIVATNDAITATTAANNAVAEVNLITTNFVSRGTWDSTVSYTNRNTVLYNGSTYQSLADDNLGNQPDTSPLWQLVASKGADGMGTVQGVSAASPNVIVGGTAQNPTIDVNAGTDANQLLKLNSNGGFVLTGQIKVTQATNTAGLILEGESSGWASGVILNNTTATTGRKYGIYSNSSGSLQITDETDEIAPATRMHISSSGNITIEKNLSVLNGADALNLKANGENDHVYIGLFARASSPMTRSGVIGFTSNGSTTFNIQNEIENGNLQLSVVGDGKIYAKNNILSDSSNNATFIGTITSTVADGTAPFVITSKTMIPNLNSEFINGIKITVGAVPPSSPKENDIWFDTN